MCWSGRSEKPVNSSKARLVRDEEKPDWTEPSWARMFFGRAMLGLGRALHWKWKTKKEKKKGSSSGVYLPKMFSYSSSISSTIWF